MKITKVREAGLNLIKKYEGFKSKPYLCPASVPTIGFGSTYYEDGHKVKLTDPSISEAEASSLLEALLVSYEKGVKSIITSELTQNQFDALVCFVYNLGLGALQRKEGGKIVQTTICKKVNLNPNDPTIKEEFLRWNKAGGRVIAGLTKRREEEAKLYFS